MLVKECMTKKVSRLTPNDTLRAAVKLMSDKDVGAVLIEENDRLVGVLTDRDIVVRAFKEGLDLSAPIRKAMTPKILYCFDDDSIEDVADNMGKNQVHRLPVIDHNKRLVGIVSVGDISTKASKKSAGAALAKICEHTHH